MCGRCWLARDWVHVFVVLLVGGWDVCRVQVEEAGPAGGLSCVQRVSKDEKDGAL